MENILLETSVHWLSKEIGSRLQLGFTFEKFAKNVTVISHKNHTKQQPFTRG